MDIDLTHAYREGYNFDSNNYLNRAWKRFGKDYGVFIGMSLLFFILGIVLSFIPIVSLFNGTFSSLLYAGFYIYCRNMNRQTQQTGDFFGGFKFLKDILLYNIVVFLLIVPLLFISISSVIPFEVFWEMVQGSIDPYDIEGRIDQDGIANLPLFFIGMMVFMALAIYISISFVFAIPLIVDAGLGFWPAMELSRKTVGRNFFAFLVFGIVFVLTVAFGTVLTCGIGLLFFIPFSYVLIFEMYDQIFNPEPSSFLSEDSSIE